MTRKPNAGFTLIELILSLSLSTFVLMGIVMVAASAMRAHFEQIRKGEANVYTLYSAQQLTRDLEEATYIPPNFPPAGAGGGNVLKGCKNYSPILNAQGDGRYDKTDGGPYDPDGAGASPPTSFYFVYCVKVEANDTPRLKADGTTTPWAPPQRSLYRYTGSPCADTLPTPENTCGTGGEVVVSNRFYPYSDTNPDAARFFRSSANERRVRLRYSIGISTPTQNVPTPNYFLVDTMITPVKGIYAD